jgi:hypothetical protein
MEAVQEITTPEQASDPVLNHSWAVGICRRVAKSYKLRGKQEFDDIVSAAVLEICKRRLRFQPSPDAYDLLGAFRGWSYRAVMTAAQKEAERLQNGGTYNERRRIQGDKPVVAEQLSTYQRTDDDGDRSEFVVMSTRDLDERAWWERRA